MRKLGILAALGLTATLAVVLAAGPAAPGNTTPSTTVVMPGLNNPRGLAFGPGGWLYVAEAGSGGTGACLMIRGANQCVGATGSVSRWKPGRTPQRVATGLPSYAAQASPTTPPSDATGPHDIGFDDGKAWITIGLGGDPAVIRAAFGNGFGRLVKMRRNGSWLFSTDISAHEAT
ncbi:MAG: ScyD/ScyE family protein, partial [Gaiellales bacterium]